MYVRLITWKMFPFRKSTCGIKRKTIVHCQCLLNAAISFINQKSFLERSRPIYSCRSTKCFRYIFEHTVAIKLTLFFFSIAACTEKRKTVEVLQQSAWRMRNVWDAKLRTAMSEDACKASTQVSKVYDRCCRTTKARNWARYVWSMSHSNI